MTALTASRVDICGRRLFLRRQGAGTPTVILEAGLGGTTQDWSDVYAAIGWMTTVCCYDRAGLGRSDPAPTPRTAADLAADLAALLACANLQPPFIVVAHSISGMHVRLFARQHPTLVAGLILVDATHEDKYAAFTAILSPELQDRNRTYLRDPARNSEHLDILASIDQLRAGRRALDCPVAILARGRADDPSPVWPSADLQAAELESMRSFAAESPRSTFQIAEQSGHFIQQDQPELVVAAIEAMVNSVRGQE
jgi:pimeloyl-ACP methyl ester carboxylesterase